MLPGLGLLEVVAAEKLRSSPDEGLSVSQLGCAFGDFEDLTGQSTRSGQGGTYVAYLRWIF